MSLKTATSANGHRWNRQGCSLAQQEGLVFVVRRSEGPPIAEAGVSWVVNGEGSFFVIYGFLVPTLIYGIGQSHPFMELIFGVLFNGKNHDFTNTQEIPWKISRCFGPLVSGV